jgi:hypothetical protein
MAMLRGCVLALVLYLGLAALYVYWLDRVFDPPQSVIGGCVLGLVVFFAIGALLNARNAWRESSLAAAAEHDLPPADGRAVGFSGTIHPVADSVIAPFSGAACVLCEYDVTDGARAAPTQKQGNPGVDFTGFLMRPCLVRSRLEDVKLLGFPQLEGFGEHRCTSDAAVRNARNFLLATTFENASGLKLGKALSALFQVWSDDDGLVERHLRIGSREPAALFPPELAHRLSAVPAEALADEAQMDDEAEEDFGENDVDDEDFEIEEGDEDAQLSGSAYRIPKLVEKRVGVGDAVTVFGVYSREKRGLLPLPASRGGAIRLLRGKAAKTSAALRSSAIRHVVGGLIALVAAHGIAYGIMQASWHSANEREKRIGQMMEAARKPDLPRLQKLVGRGMSVDSRDAEGRTPLLVTNDPAIARWLIEQGADVNARATNGETPLSAAQLHGQTEIAELLIAAGAKSGERSRP